MIRRSAFAGKFYPSSEHELSMAVDKCISEAKVDGRLAKKALSYVAPHSGYEYSGGTAGFAYKALSMRSDLAEIDTFVMIGPNHTGRGYRVSVSGSDWKTPLGIVRNDKELTDRMVLMSGYLNLDESAHEEEHSIEVQLPFLQKTVNKPRCCFICMADQSIEASSAVAGAINDAAKSLGRNIVVIASSDLNHYEPQAVAKKKDSQALRELEAIDLEGFHRKLAHLDNSACGYGPITVSGLIAKSSGGSKGHLLKYSTSADITKDYKAVVAYCSIAFS